MAKAFTVMELVKLRTLAIAKFDSLTVNIQPKDKVDAHIIVQYERIVEKLEAMIEDWVKGGTL